MDDTNYCLHRFASVTAKRLRLVAHNASHGFNPDNRVRVWGGVIAQKLMLREIEVYGPRGK